LTHNERHRYTRHVNGDRQNVRMIKNGEEEIRRRRGRKLKVDELTTLFVVYRLISCDWMTNNNELEIMLKWSWPNLQ
jgi:hypothetical protein